jgi:hypothetical protein
VQQASKCGSGAAPSIHAKTPAHIDIASMLVVIAEHWNIVAKVAEMLMS